MDITEQQREYLASIIEQRRSTVKPSIARTRMVEKLKRDGYLTYGGEITDIGRTAVTAYDMAAKAMIEARNAKRERIKSGEFPVIEPNRVDLTYFRATSARVDVQHGDWHYWFSISPDHIEWPDMVMRRPLANPTAGQSTLSRASRFDPFEHDFVAAVVGAGLKQVHERKLVAEALVRWKDQTAEKIAQRNAGIAKNVKRKYAEELFALLVQGGPKIATINRINEEITEECRRDVSDQDYDV